MSHMSHITAAGTGVSPDRHDCPAVCTIPDRPNEAFVISTDDVTDDELAELADEYNPDTEHIGRVPAWVPCGLMSLPTLGRFMDDHVHRSGDSRFRVEQLPTYSRSGADFEAWLRGEPPPSAKQDWLDELAAAVAAGISHTRVRILSSELTDYELYACQRGYALNSAYEDIRVLRRDEHDVPELIGPSDYWIVNDIVLPVVYHASGEFVGAAYIGAADERAQAYRDEAARLWDVAEPWAEWWIRHPELHDARRGRAA